MQLSLEINPSAWNYPLGKKNSEAEAAYNQSEAVRQQQYEQAQLALPEEARTAFVPAAAFVPETLEHYVQARIADVEESYLQQAGADLLAGVQADPTQANRMIVILANPDLRAQVAALADDFISQQ